MATPRRECRLCRACRHDARHAPFGRPPGGGGTLLASAAPPLAVARYAILGNVEHELLTMDVGNRLHDRGDLGLAEFLFDTEHPEIKLPAIQPGLGPTVETMGQSFLLAMSA